MSWISHRRTRFLWSACFVALTLACSEEAPPPDPGPRPVKILEIGGSGATRTLEYPGQVEAAQHAELGFEVAGQMTEFPVDEGQLVEEGAVLARLDPRDFTSDLEAKRALARQARTEFDRAKILFEKDVAPEQDVDRARRGLEVTQANLRKAEKAVDDAVLRAPFSGVVARKLVKDFRNVQAKEPVVILEDDSGLQMVANVPESDWVFARTDAESRARRQREVDPKVTLSNYPDQPIPATLREVATTADPTTRTYAFTLAFDPPEGMNVKPGMTAKVSINIPGEEMGGAIAVPARAVVDEGEGPPFVWRIDPTTLTASRAEVTLGELSGDRIEIRSGLGAGDQIATSGVHQLRDGMTVRRYTE